jgi:hypothetical protein
VGSGSLEPRDDRTVGGVGDNGRDVFERQDAVRGGGADLLGAREDVGLGSAAGKQTFHGGLVGVAGGQPLGRVHARDAEEEEIRGDGPGGFGGSGAAGHRRVFEELTADQKHVDRPVLDEGCGDRRTVGDDGRREAGGEGLDDGEGRRPPVQDHAIAGLDQGRGPGGHAALAVGFDGRAGGVVRDRGRGGAKPVQFEAYNYDSKPGRLELDNIYKKRRSSTADRAVVRKLEKLLDQAMTDEIQAPVPAALQSVQSAAFTEWFSEPPADFTKGTDN